MKKPLYLSLFSILLLGACIKEEKGDHVCSCHMEKRYNVGNSTVITRDTSFTINNMTRSSADLECDIIGGEISSQDTVIYSDTNCDLL